MSVTPVEARSNVLPRFQAPMTPIQTPMSMASSVDVPTSRTVGQSRSMIRSLTGTR